MRTIEVGGMVFHVMYAGVSPFTDQFKTQIYYSPMNLGQIAAMLDGNDGIEYTDGDQTEIFEGYSKLTSISYVDNETLVAFLVKDEVVNNGTIPETL